MTTAYAQDLRARAAREVAETGFIRASTADAFYNLGYSWGTIGLLEADLREAAKGAWAQ